MDGQPDTPAPDTPADSAAPEGPDRLRRRLPRAVWTILLGVYLLIFATTGYLAFMLQDTSPGYAQYETVERIQDADTKAFVIDALQREDDEHKKRRELAMHSFNVVLGALLGFLTATATSWLRGDSEDV